MQIRASQGRGTVFHLTSQLLKSTCGFFKSEISPKLQFTVWIECDSQNVPQGQKCLFVCLDIPHVPGTHLTSKKCYCMKLQLLQIFKSKQVLTLMWPCKYGVGLKVCSVFNQPNINTE